MKEVPKVGDLVKVIKTHKNVWDLQLVDKIGIVRLLFESFCGRVIIGVEFVSWEKGHRLLFDMLDKNTGWFLYAENLEQVKYD
jgi:hypothetical protein